ncbi:ribonuclease H-like domain-containing protein, partial [Tanacetum coccineum]
MKANLPISQPGQIGPNKHNPPINPNVQYPSRSNTSDCISNTHPNGPLHAKDGISKPINRLSLHTTNTLPLYRSHVYALHDPNWQKAMHKYHADGSLSHYKACLVANGRSQQDDIDYDETFSPIVKPATIRTVLSIVVSRSWPIHQLDVKNAFFHGHLSKTIYMDQPPGFVDPQRPNYSKTDSSLFIYHRGSDIAYLLLYVDDIILTTSSSAFLQRVIASLHGEFAMMDLACAYAKMKSMHDFVDTESKLGANGDRVSDL